MDSPAQPGPADATALFQPVYRACVGARWRVQLAGMVICPGYWSPPRLVSNLPALLRTDAGRVSTWMSLAPMELESQELGCLHATGHVVVMGLGLGWAAANAALRPAVTAVTVVEHDPEVIALVRELGVFGQLPSSAAPVTVRQGDACAFVPDTPADTLLADIWHPLFGADRDAEVRQMHARTGGSRVYFWGQEMVLAHRARQRGWPLDAATVTRLVDEMALPLIGPGERADYARLVGLAADRWLPRQV